MSRARTQRQPAELPEDEEIRNGAIRWVERTGKNIGDLAAGIGMPRSSLYYKLNHPEALRLGELRKLMDAFGEV